MEVFRIALAQYTDKLYASGRSNRWNNAGEKVIYTASSRSLACLENVVHSSGEALGQHFRVMVIYIPDNASMDTIPLNQLPEDWNQNVPSRACKELGSAWIKSNRSLLLQVPSSIIPLEKNYLINPNHLEFAKVKIVDHQEFIFDQRIKG
jgi:RES domain-containing protein